MNEDLKNIVENVNKMFETSYNLMSFDSLSNTNLLQVLGDVLVKLDIVAKIDVASNVNTAIVDILEALSTIKYSPPPELSPITFREGIVMGKRSTIYPILGWIFSNKEKVLKIKYLSSYMEKVDVPDEFKSDNDMLNLYTQYEKLIDEFWKTYNEHKKIEKQAIEASELKKDIYKMETDTSKLRELVENQKEKVAAIPNNSTLMVLAKDYHDATTERTKLEDQLKQQQKAIEALEVEVKHLNDQLQHKRTVHPTSEDPLQVIREEVHINKILAESKLPDELKSLRRELELYTVVANEPEPTQNDLSQLTEEVETVSNDIKALQRKVATNAGDDQLGPFRNQAKIIANKKKELSNIVLSLKQETEEMEAKLAERRNMLQSILGGPAMYGNELKQYISSVRDRCNLYKDLRSQEQALRGETGVLNRTIEILQTLEPSMVKALEKKEEAATDAALLDIPDNEIDLQNKCKALTKEIGKRRTEVMEKREKVLLVKKEIESFMKEYRTAKEEFEEATGPHTKKLNTVQTEVSLLESNIREQEEQYKTLQQEIEKNESILQSLSEDLMTDVNDVKSRPSKVDALKQKLTAQQEENRKLTQELKRIEDMKGANEEQINLLRIVKMFLECKLEGT